MSRVKICGITRPEDAEQAAGLGAWAIGFILWPQSKRVADPAVAAGIARGHFADGEVLDDDVLGVTDEEPEACEACGGVGA